MQIRRVVLDEHALPRRVPVTNSSLAFAIKRQEAVFGMRIQYKMCSSDSK